MTESKELYYAGPRPNKELSPTIWNMIQQMAPVMHQARLFGVSSLEQAAAIMLKGYELGIGFTASFELVQVVQGKPTLSPRGALALLHSAPEIRTIKIERLVDATGKFTGYSCYMQRINGFEYTARWTLEDAKRAGLIKSGGGWEAYPENMCMWRAIGFAADVVAPDITAGLTASMKMPEQLGMGIDDGGNMVVIDAVATPAPAPVVESAPMLSLEQLLSLFGPDAVLAANGGKFPSTDAEINTIGLKLAGGMA
jgi:hypothetical protein